MLAEIRKEDLYVKFMKKQILILSSNGGYGHHAAAHTLKEVLGKKYNLKIIYPIDELRIWGVRSGEQIYNTMLQYGWIRSMNWIAKHVAPRLFHSRRKRIEKMITKYLEKERFDLVISLIPFINYPATEAARKNNIPFLLVTTDNDLRNWVHGLHEVTHPRFKVTIGNDLPSTRKMLRQSKIAKEAIETIGLPLRLDFKQNSKLQELYLQYGAPDDKRTVLIMMGGAGAKVTFLYAKKIGCLPLGIHLLVCSGKNSSLIRKLKKIRLHPSNSISVLDFTEKVSDLMAMADLLITKPGPGTLNEAMAMNLPVLVDHTSSPLSWEKANIDMVLRYGIGKEIQDHEEIPHLVTSYLNDAEVQEKTEEAFSILNKHISNAFNQSNNVSHNLNSLGQKIESTAMLSAPQQKMIE